MRWTLNRLCICVIFTLCMDIVFGLWYTLDYVVYMILDEAFLVN